MVMGDTQSVPSFGSFVTLKLVVRPNLSPQSCVVRPVFFGQKTRIKLRNPRTPAAIFCLIFNRVGNLGNRINALLRFCQIQRISETEQN